MPGPEYEKKRPPGREGEVRRSILVSGSVQGVGYRNFTVREAVRLGLNGFCRNLSSGEVEIEAEGTAEKLSELILLLQEGPPRGKVDKVSVYNIPLKNDSVFVILYA